jgi:hypothetical protein
MEPYHAENQSLAEAWSTALVGLDTDGLATNHKGCVLCVCVCQQGRSYVRET